MKYIQFFRKKVIERDKDVPYLIRWNLFGLGEDSKFFSIKIHKIIKSDHECLHDHPWWFISILLKGQYKEWRNINNGDYYSGLELRHEPKSDTNIGGRIYKAGSILIRPANWAHRLEVTEPCYTLVFTFKKIRDWGFITKGGWKFWQEYSNDRDC